MVRRLTVVAGAAVLAFVLSAGATAAGAATPGSGPATVADPVVQTIPVPSFATGTPPAQKSFFDSDDLRVKFADTTRGVQLSSGDVIAFGVVPPTGRKLVPGSFLWKDDGNGIVAVKDAWPGDYTLRPISILDVGSTASGAITRFDAVVQGFGEIRFGEPADTAPAVLGTRDIVFDQQFVGSAATLAPETIHNRGTSAVAIGSPTVAGPSASSFAVSADTCGRSLAPGARCTFQVGFSPAKHGPLSASVSVPIGGVTRTIALTGSANLGTSRISLSGGVLDETGGPTTDTAGPRGMSVSGNGPHIIFVTYGPTTKGTDPRLGVVVDSGTGTAPAIGTRKTSPGGSADVQVTAFGRGDTTSGTETVSTFRVDALGRPSVVKMSFTAVYDDGPAPLTGELLWQYRSDVTAPKPVTSVTAAGGVVRWTPSKSTDSSHVVARLVTGSGAAATPQSGVPLVPSGARAALAAQASGQKYTVVLYDVDTSGNLSAPALLHLY